MNGMRKRKVINGKKQVDKGTEILLAMLLESSGKIKSFKRSWTKVHSFFFEMKQTEEFSDLFIDFLFDTNGPYPYCEKLDEILSEFQLTGIIGSSNPMLREYLINVNKQDTKDLSFSLSAEELSKIEKLANAFSKNVGIASWESRR
jgi:hypothetical protein